MDVSSKELAGSAGSCAQYTARNHRKLLASALAIKIRGRPEQRFHIFYGFSGLGRENGQLGPISIDRLAG